MAFLRAQAAQSVSAAVHALRPAEIRFAVAESPPKTHRNRLAPGEIDDEIGALQVRRLHGAIMATLVNWGCHPAILNEPMITSDFPGYLRQEVERAGGGRALFFQGIVGGGVSPCRDSDTYAEAERIGRAVGAAAVAALDNAAWVTRVSLCTRRAPVSLPAGNTGFRLAPLGGPLTRFRAPTIATEVNLVDLGDAQIIGVPGEVFPALGLKMKGLLRAKHKFLFGLMSDELGYILPEEYVSRNCYAYEVLMSVGPRTGSLLYEALEKLANPKP
jgi:hypothetical protein